MLFKSALTCLVLTALLQNVSSMNKDEMKQLRANLINDIQNRLIAMPRNMPHTMTTVHTPIVQQRPQMQQAPMHQEQIQQAPMQQVPMQQAPMQQVPMQQAPMQQAPMQQAPIQQVPMHQNFERPSFAISHPPQMEQHRQEPLQIRKPMNMQQEPMHQNLERPSFTISHLPQMEQHQPMQIHKQEILATPTPSFQQNQQFAPQEPHRLTTVHTPTVQEQQPHMHQALMQQEPIHQEPMLQRPMQQEPMQQRPVQQESMQQKPMLQRPMQQAAVELASVGRVIPEHEKKNWRTDIRSFRRPDLQSSGWLLDNRHGLVEKPWGFDEFAHERARNRNPIYLSSRQHKVAGNIRKMLFRGIG